MDENKRLKVVIAQFEKLGKTKTKKLSNYLKTLNIKALQKSADLKNWKNNYDELANVVESLKSNIERINNEQPQTSAGVMSKRLTLEQTATKLDVAQKLFDKLDLLKKLDSTDSRDCIDMLELINNQDYALLTEACKILQKKIDSILILDEIAIMYPNYEELKQSDNKELTVIANILIEREKELDETFEKIKDLKEKQNAEFEKMEKEHNAKIKEIQEGLDPEFEAMIDNILGKPEDDKNEQSNNNSSDKTSSTSTKAPTKPSKDSTEPNR